MQDPRLQGTLGNKDLSLPASPPGGAESGDQLAAAGPVALSLARDVVTVGPSNAEGHRAHSHLAGQRPPWCPVSIVAGVGVRTPLAASDVCFARGSCACPRARQCVSHGSCAGRGLSSEVALRQP